MYIRVTGLDMRAGRNHELRRQNFIIMTSETESESDHCQWQLETSVSRPEDTNLRPPTFSYVRQTDFSDRPESYPS